MSNYLDYLVYKEKCCQIALISVIGTNTASIYFNNQVKKLYILLKQIQCCQMVAKLKFLQIYLKPTSITLYTSIEK